VVLGLSLVDILIIGLGLGLVSPGLVNITAYRPTMISINIGHHYSLSEVGPLLV
jgi:hypothetical protein